MSLAEYCAKANFNSNLFSGYLSSFAGLASTLFLHTGPVPIVSHHGSLFVLYVALLLLGRVYFRGVTAQIAKEEYRTIKISNRLHRLMSNSSDYELVPFVVNRIRMYLGLKKQKKIRHHVRFEGMITPLSRGSSFVEFDDLDFDQRSEYTEIEDCFITDSESALTKISDSSVWTSSK